MSQSAAEVSDELRIVTLLDGTEHLQMPPDELIIGAQSLVVWQRRVILNPDAAIGEGAIQAESLTPGTVDKWLEDGERMSLRPLPKDDRKGTIFLPFGGFMQRFYSDRNQPLFDQVITPVRLPHNWFSRVGLRIVTDTAQH